MGLGNLYRTIYECEEHKWIGIHEGIPEWCHQLFALMVKRVAE